MQTNNLESTTQVNFLKLPAIKAQTGLSRTAIYLAIQRGTFPKPIKIGKRSVAWISTDIKSWVLEKINQSSKK